MTTSAITKQPKDKAWHRRPSEDVPAPLDPKATGLSSTTEAAKHAAANGPNALKEGKRIRPLLIFPGRKIHWAWTIPGLAAKKFFQIDGTQWAGAFAFNAFFSLFPLMILLVTIVSSFVDKDIAGKTVIAYMEGYFPISGEMQHLIFNGIAGVINSREQAGLVALLALVWTAIQCFTTLIVATNRAWGAEVYNWWRLPLKSLALLGITAGAVLLGMAVPVLIRMAKAWLFPMVDFRSWVDNLVSFFIPSVVVFFGLSLFYRFIPSRPTRFAEVWVAALGTTVLLRAAESLFIIYLKDFATLNAVYGAFGGVMALLLWVYVSGCIFIYGACLCAGQAEMRSVPEKTPVAQEDKRDEP
jgi:Ca2+-transporting ATPase